MPSRKAPKISESLRRAAEDSFAILVRQFNMLKFLSLCLATEKQRNRYRIDVSQAAR
jgi:hypothetical protein